MYPLNDFNFMFGGLATFAATVGYACARKRSMRRRSESPARQSKDSDSMNTDDEPSSVSAEKAMESNDRDMQSVVVCNEMPPVVVSLKRKYSDDDEDLNAGYPYNLSHIYPNKRSKTPTKSESDYEGKSEVMKNDPAPMIPDAFAEEAVLKTTQFSTCTAPPAPQPSTQQTDIHSQHQLSSNPVLSSSPPPSTATAIEQSTAATTPARPHTQETGKNAESTIMNLNNTSTQHQQQQEQQQQPPNAISGSSSHNHNHVVATPNANWMGTGFTLAPPASAAPSRPQTPKSFNAFNASNASRGFAAFAAGGSGFAVGAGDRGQGNKASSSTSTRTPKKEGRPVWSAGAAEGVSPSNLNGESERSKGKGRAGEVGEVKGSENGGNALEQGKRVKTTYNHTTGEEDETVSAELKGVKLFVKRGGKDFSTGMIGNVKLLTREGGRSGRLLFRREPLWKVNMNVPLKATTVRCTYTAEESVLRVVLKERVGGVQEMVVYALKRGRATQEDFRELVEAVVKSPLLAA